MWGSAEVLVKGSQKGWGGGWVLVDSQSGNPFTSRWMGCRDYRRIMMVHQAIYKSTNKRERETVNYLPLKKDWLNFQIVKVAIGIVE